MSKSLLLLAEQRHQQNLDSLEAVLLMQLNAECSGTTVKVRWNDPVTKELFYLTGKVKNVAMSHFDRNLSFLIEVCSPNSGEKMTVIRSIGELYE